MAFSGKKTAAVVGGVVLVAAIGFFLLRVQDLSAGYVKLHVFMDDASGLIDGTQVRINGIPIGYLESQRLTNSRDLDRKVEFWLKVKRSYLREIPVDSRVGLASDNLLGDQHIAIRRGQSAEHVQPGAELRASLSVDITRMMAQMSRQLDRLQAVMTRAGKLSESISSGKGAIGKMVQDPAKLKAGGGASGELDRLMADVQHGNGTITKLFYEDPFAKQLDSPVKRLNEVMASADATSAQLKEFQDGVQEATHQYETLQAELKAGKGSVGKLGQLETQLSELSARIDGLMDKINSGNGTLGQLFVNPQLNEALAGTTREFQELAKGLRANPRKFVSIRVF